MATRPRASRSAAFSTQVKTELARLDLARSCCLRAELSALLKSAGSLVLGRTRRLKLITEHSGTARRVFLLGKELYGWKGRILTRQRQRLKKNRVFMVEIPVDGKVLSGLKELGIVHDGGVPEGDYHRLLSGRCCRRAYLRGCFLAAGSALSPGRGYHLSLVLADEEQLVRVSQLLSSFSIKPQKGYHRGLPLLYIKEGEAVALFLQVIGAHQSLLSFESQRVLRDMKNRANRQVNAETANLEKTIQAGIRQASALARLERSGLLDHLPGSFRELARLRMENPDLSLRELGEMMVPPLSKSAISYRIKKMELLDEWKRDGGNEGGVSV